LFGQDSLKDCGQGGIGNCWLQSAIAGLNEHMEYVKELFITEKRNKAGLYCMKFYPMGV